MNKEIIALTVKTLFESIRRSQTTHYETHGVYEQTAEQSGDGFSYRCNSYGKPDGWCLLAFAVIEGVQHSMALDCGTNPSMNFDLLPVSPTEF